MFSDVTNDMAIAREEIFGPVLVIIAYDDEADAIRIANDSDYGLWAGGWSASQERARDVARQLRVGGVSINGGDGLGLDAVRGLQAVGPRPRDGTVRPGGVPRGEGARRLTAQVLASVPTPDYPVSSS